MIHPYVLRARAALWALRDALNAVPEAIRDEAITRVPIGPPSSGQPRYARGPRSNARLSALLHDERADRVTNQRAGIQQIGVTSAPVRAELLDLARRAPVLVDELTTDAAWIIASSLRRRPLLVYGHAWTLAARLLVDEHPAIAYLRVALPYAPPAVARDVLAVLDNEADTAWSTLRLDRPHTQVPDNPPCPACGTRMLRIETSGPRADWVVTCGAGCVCAGNGCPCGMPVRPEQARHIWTFPDVWALAIGERAA